MPIVTLEELHARIGTQIGISEWITIDQKRIDEFADVTEDRQFIHVDPNAAKETMFGGTVAHGFLSLSLLSRMAFDVMLVPDNLKMAVNYGFDRVRFISPAAVDERLRIHYVPTEAREHRAGLLSSVEVTVETEASTVLAARWLGLAVWPEVHP